MPSLTYKTAQSIYTRLCILKNRSLNLLDPPMVVLVYHRITMLPSDPQQLAVSPDNFRAHVLFLKNNFQIVRFEDDWSKINKPSVAITFDDGYADNALEALPILEEVGVPATFFVSTGNIGTSHEFWWDELERVILGERDYPASFTLTDRQYGNIWRTDSFALRETLYSTLHQMMMRIDFDQRANWFDQLRVWGQFDRTGREQNRPLSHDELRLLAISRWTTIGAHTVTHTALSCQSEEQQRVEIISSKRQLETLLVKEITVFSYPFGRKNDYNAASISICKEAGFIKSAANFPGQSHRWTDPYQIPRQLVRNWDEASFADKMKRFGV
jgi:peptidoglycan/xylan/chitin deacetylase (PgdA/CDA1 family)